MRNRSETQDKKIGSVEPIFAVLAQLGKYRLAQYSQQLLANGIDTADTANTGIFWYLGFT